MITPPENLDSFDALVAVVTALRGPEGCPWDKEQTHRTLARYAIEEAHELADAIENSDVKEAVGELGDLLLQVVLHAEIGRQDGTFTLQDVVRGINEKMVRRHPHVFATAEVSGSAEVLQNWSKIKASEKAQAGGNAATPARFDIPTSLPALQRAEKIGHKTRDVRFDWSKWQDVLTKVEEEIGELKQALAGTDRAQREHELGDVLFSLAQLARHLDIDAEQSLRVANRRFERRYFQMLELVAGDGKDFANLTNIEMESYWQQVKRAE